MVMGTMGSASQSSSTSGISGISLRRGKVKSSKNIEKLQVNDVQNKELNVQKQQKKVYHYKMQQLINDLV